MKINHRNEDVRKKAETLINKIKEYRRRGRLNDGVDVVSGKIFLRSVALEPNMQETLPGLDPTNVDDRFLASVVELMQTNVRSSVMIVTRDINLQNKAEMARVPYCEPPSI